MCISWSHSFKSLSTITTQRNIALSEHFFSSSCTQSHLTVFHRGTKAFVYRLKTAPLAIHFQRWQLCNRMKCKHAYFFLSLVPICFNGLLLFKCHYDAFLSQHPKAHKKSQRLCKLKKINISYPNFVTITVYQYIHVGYFGINLDYNQSIKDQDMLPH